MRKLQPDFAQIAKKSIFLIVFLSLSFGLLAQNSVTGKVLDNNGVPLSGASVVVKGGNRGTTTNAAGEFSILARPGETLEFSMVGFRVGSVKVSNSASISLRLQANTDAIEQVVVIGYGTQKKKDITGAVASVNMDNVMKRAPFNIAQSLQGSAAGVQVTMQDGAPEANAAIRIRGIATINGTADPLYVVDGVQVGRSANFITPNDVESIDVLKDASATAIYGSEGANGVIMITTKHGKGTAHINFAANFSSENLAKKLDISGIDQYAANIRTARANDGGNLANPIFSTTYDGKRKFIDWQGVMSKPSFKQQYYLSGSGGGEKTQASFSMSYVNNNGLVVNTNLKRMTIRANVITKLTNFIEVGGDVNFVHTENHGSNAGNGNNGNFSSLRDWAFQSPTMDYIDAVTGQLVSPNVKNANGTYGTYIQSSSGNYDGGSSDNIYAEQMENNGLSKNNQILVSAYVNVRLYKGLTFKSIASYNYLTGSWQNFYGNKKRYMPDGVTPVVLANYDTRYHLDLSQNQGNYPAIENYLTYNWSNKINNLTLMAGNSVSNSFGTSVNSSAVGFPGANIRDISLTSDITSITGGGSYSAQVRGLSYFGRATYSLLDRYMLTGTLRRDGSSKFGSDNRYGNFPSAAAAWRISEEAFMKDKTPISNLKLRLGWGQTGNSGTVAEAATAALTSSSIAYYYYGQDGIAGIGSTAQSAIGYVSNLVDTRLKWETNEQSNIGLDLGFLNNSLNITADYFTRKAKNLLLYQQIRPSAGYTQVYTNYGEIDNRGFEFSIDYKKTINNDWSFGATLTGSTIKNKIVNIGPDILNDNEGSTGDGSNVGAVGAAASVYWGGSSLCRNGYAVGSFYGYQVEGVFQSQAEVDKINLAATAAGHSQYQNAQTGPGDFKYKDVNGDGFIDQNDLTVLGNGFPKLNFGLNLNVAYKNWDLSIFSYGVFGQQILSYSAMKLSSVYSSDDGVGVPNILKEASANAWTPANHSTTLPKLSILDYNQNMRCSSAWVKNGDFVKIGNLSVGYNINKRMLAPLHVESARVNISVQNLLCISPYNKYGDPEAGQGSVLYTGLDTGRYPNPRIFSAGFNVQF